MNGLNSLRRRYAETDPMLGPIFPNVPGPPPPIIEDVSQPESDNTVNSLLNFFKSFLGGASTEQGQAIQDGSKPTKEYPYTWRMPSGQGYDRRFFTGSTYTGPEFPGGAVKLTAFPLLSPEPADPDRVGIKPNALYYHGSNVEYKGPRREDYIPGSGAYEAARKEYDASMGYSYSRARGGPMAHGYPYVVGEEGPEIIIPQSDGTVIPSSAVAPILQEATPVFPEPPSQNAILNAISRPTAPMTKKPTNALLDYWAKPVIGGIPRDMFVQLAGSLAHAIAPREWSGRIGANLAQMGGQAYAERIRREREEPENVLRRRLLEAQAKKLEEPEKPTEWGAFYKEHMNTINPATGRTYTVGETLKAFHEAQKVVTPKEPKYNIDVQKNPNTGEWEHGRRNESTGVFTADRLATEAEIASKVTGKIKETEAPTLKEEYKNINGIPHKRQIEWDSAIKKWIPKGDWIRTEKPEKPLAGEKLSMTDIKSAYSMDIGNIKNQMMIEMTPDEQANLAGQPDVNILALLLAGRVGKSLSPERKQYYIGRLQEAETYYGDLTNQVLGRKGAKIPAKTSGKVAPETGSSRILTDVEYKGPVATGKIVPRVIAPEEIFKDKQGREMVKDPTSSTGWRYK